MNICTTAKQIGHRLLQTETWEQTQLPDWARSTLAQVKSEIDLGSATISDPKFCSNDQPFSPHSIEIAVRGNEASLVVRKVSDGKGGLSYCEFDLLRHDMPKGLNGYGSKIAAKLYKALRAKEALKD